jgi:predicted TIM-barrel fold metal-dependent hydrolase
VPQPETAPRPRVVDTAVHTWIDPNRVWPPGIPRHAPNPFTCEMLLEEMDAAGVDRAVIICGDDTLEYAAEAAERLPDRLGVMCSLDPTEPDAVDRVRTWRDRPGMIGLRLHFFMDFPELGWLSEGRYDPIWDAAQEAGVPVAVRVTDLAPKIGEIAGKHPGLNLLIDHVAAIPRKVDEPFIHLPQVCDLASHQNVSVKVSGLAFYSQQPSPYPDVDWVVRELRDAFGAERLMWGTDLTRMFGDGHNYPGLLAQVREGCDFLTDAERDLICGESALQILGWN